MDLHRLEFQAIGPFPGRHAIDFDDLSAAGLFLLEGPTGSGKSSIIDAITFALYGKVAASTASDDRMRSTHAAPDVASYVSLTYSSGRGRYRVWRAPAYDRPKKRGGGTTREKAAVKFFRLVGEDDADGELVSTRPEEVGAEVVASLGLDRGQFTKTVVLAQGEFASFLRAKSDDRRKLLQQIFGTASYEAWEKRIAEMAREGRQRLDQARVQVGNMLSQFAGASERDIAPLTQLAQPPLAEEDVESAVAERIGDLAGRAAEAASQAVTAEARLKDATATVEATQKLAELLGRYVRAAEDKKGLDRQADAIADARATLNRVEAADRVAPVLAAEEQARGRYDDALGVAEQVIPPALAPGGGFAGSGDGPAGLGAGVGSAAGEAAEPVGGISGSELWGRIAREALAWPEDLLGLAGEWSRSWTGLAERERSAAAALGDLADTEAGLPGRETELTQQETALAGLEARREAMAGEVQQRPAARQEIDGQLTTARAGAQKAGELERLAADAATALDDVIWCDDESARIAQDRVTLARIAKEAQRAVSEAAGLRQRRIAGMAGELAVKLGDGEPCPVCGATEHPVLATLQDDHPSADDVEAAESAANKAEDEVRQASEELSAAEAALRTRRERHSGLTREAAERALKDARTAARKASEDVTRAAELEQALQYFDEQTATLSEQLAGLREQIATATQAVTTARASLGKDRARIADALAVYPGAATTIAALRANLLGGCERAARIAGTLRDLVAVARDAGQRIAEARAATEREGLDAAALAAARAIGADEVQALRNRVAAYERSVIEVGLELGQLDGEPELTAALAGADAEVALAAAKEQLASATQARADAQARYTAAHSASDSATQLATRAEAAALAVRDALGNYRTVASELGPVRHVADVVTAGSDNAKRVTLASYVLMRRFEEVVDAANERLRIMLDGRYELQRTDDRQHDDGLKAGLGLAVIDRLTDGLRETSTLSGGETFCVSLALALGLADVVRSEAGGVDLKTLFVDEGFGSLSDDSLDQVLGVLSSLLSSGRVVGVVSHVEAMKSAIHDRITVRRQPDGTSALTVVS